MGTEENPAAITGLGGAVAVAAAEDSRGFGVEQKPAGMWTELHFLCEPE